MDLNCVNKSKFMTDNVLQSRHSGEQHQRLTTIAMETPFIRLKTIKVEGKDEDNHAPQPAHKCSMTAMDVDLTIDCVVRDASLETTMNDEKTG